MIAAATSGVDAVYVLASMAVTAAAMVPLVLRENRSFVKIADARLRAAEETSEQNHRLWIAERARCDGLEREVVRQAAEIQVLRTRLDLLNGKDTP